MRLSSVPPYRWLAMAYVEVFRGLPALLIFIFVGVGVPLAFPGTQIPGGTVGKVALALALVSAAYMAETVRAGIQAVPQGPAGGGPLARHVEQPGDGLASSSRRRSGSSSRR